MPAIFDPRFLEAFEGLMKESDCSPSTTLESTDAIDVKKR